MPHGEAANVFGKPKSNTDFQPYNGDGFKLEPEQREGVPGTGAEVDTTSNVNIIITTTDKKSITDFGSPEQFLSQGGFESDACDGQHSAPVISEKPYYFISVLTRMTDGDEGSKHQLINASVKDGKLSICKAQAGDKRWFKGARKFVENTANSFSFA